MFPQSELDNYKLQVELLQEKLKRSEEHRQQLQDKFEGIMKRRSDHEKLLKVKSRLKYQTFLEEQRERNERNKTLVRALEKVDQQAAVLASRSERLKILKMQYELYFGKVLQCQYPMGPLHTNYHYPATIPLNRLHFGSNHNRSTIEEMFMPQNNVSNFGNIPEFGSYLFPATTSKTDVSKEPIVSNQGGIEQRQVNLKSTLGDGITARATLQDLPNRTDVFADFRNPIDLNRYEMPNPKPIEPFADGNDGKSRTNTILESDNQQQQLRQNLKEAQGTSKAAYNTGNFEYIPRTHSPQKQSSSEPHHPEYQPLTLDKLHHIKKDSTLERLVATVNDNASKTDNGPGEGEKSQSMYTAQGENLSTPSDESKRAIDGAKSMLSSTQIAEEEADDTSNKKDPVLWNFGGRIDKPGSDYPSQIKKKEKISIETMEKEIYGERITPGSSISGSHLGNLEQIFSDSVKIESHEEKSDMSEKIEEGSLVNEGSLNTPIVDIKPIQGDRNYVNYSEPTPQEYDPKYTEDYAGYGQSQTNSFAGYEEPVDYEKNEQGEQQEYVDTQLSEYQEQQPQNPQYDYSQYQNQDYQYQDPTYIQNEDPNYVQTEDQNYAMDPDSKYLQNPDPSLAQNQDENFIQNQNFGPEYQQREYQPTEYDQSQQQQDQQQYGDPTGYTYNYDQPVEGSFDPNIQQYSDPQYEQQTVGQSFDPNIQQYTEPQYEQQTVEQSFDPNIQQYADPQYEQQSYDGNSYQQPENPEADYQQQQEVQQPTPYDSERPSRESIQQELNEVDQNLITPSSGIETDGSIASATPTISPRIVPDVPPTAKVESSKSEPSSSGSGNGKPTSILSSTEKPHDSPGKGKKKKRVNFIDSETEESSSTTKTNPGTAQNNDESDFDFSTS